MRNKKSNHSLWRTVVDKYRMDEISEQDLIKHINELVYACYFYLLQKRSGNVVGPLLDGLQTILDEPVNLGVLSPTPRSGDVQNPDTTAWEALIIGRALNLRTLANNPFILEVIPKAQQVVDVIDQFTKNSEDFSDWSDISENPAPEANQN